MLALRFNGCNKLQQLFAFYTCSAQHIGHFWDAGGDGSRFIEDKRICLCKLFGKLAALYKNAVF